MFLILMVFSALVLWLVGEFVAFSLVAQAIGLNGAILATLATSFAGGWLLHRLGATARTNLLAIVNLNDTAGWFAPERLRAGLAAALGSFFLVLPGFLTDIVGLLLLARATQGWLSSGARPGSTDDDVLELSPQEWRHIDGADRH